jgi:hypothetical protein
MIEAAISALGVCFNMPTAFVGFSLLFLTPAHDDAADDL